MESFSLLKYWRTAATSTLTTPTSTTAPETEDSCSTTSSSDEGPFFDLEFALPDDDDDDDEQEEKDFNFTLPTDHPLPISPSDDLFFKRTLHPLDPPQPNSKHHHHHHSLKSKLLVLALGLKKNHHQTSKESPPNPTTSPAAYKQKHGRFFAVKFKVEEVPIMSLFTRDNKTLQKPSVDEEEPGKRTSKETLQRYLSKIKPLYVKVSKKHHNEAEPAECVEGAAEPPPAAPATGGEIVKVQKGMQVAEHLRVVCKHLGKSRSASSAVAAVASPQTVVARRDDSLLQQQDGIQSAIAHCKRSFNGTRDTPDSALHRSRYDYCDESMCTDKCMEDCV